MNRHHLTTRRPYTWIAVIFVLIALAGGGMSAHTKGPWKFIDVIGGCSVYAGTRQVLSYLHSPDAENKANARLIAAAPDLLAMLSDLLAMCERQTDFNDDGDGAMFERANAAIAKATGAA